MRHTIKIPTFESKTCADLMQQAYDSMLAEFEKKLRRLDRKMYLVEQITEVVVQDGKPTIDGQRFIDLVVQAGIPLDTVKKMLGVDE